MFSFAPSKPLLSWLTYSKASSSNITANFKNVMPVFWLIVTLTETSSPKLNICGVEETGVAAVASTPTFKVSVSADSATAETANTENIRAAAKKIAKNLFSCTSYYLQIKGLNNCCREQWRRGGEQSRRRQ